MFCLVPLCAEHLSTLATMPDRGNASRAKPPNDSRALPEVPAK